jgi:cytidylate kinase
MSIVAISDTLGSRGEVMGRELARRLGWEFADREMIAKAAEQFGEAVGELHQVTEERPSLWERFTDSKRRYLLYVEASVFEMAARGRVVIVGHGSTIMLRDVPHALRVRVSAPERARVERIRESRGLSDEAALDLVRESDGERAARMRYLYHVDMDDAFLYDLTINSERVGHRHAALEIVRAVPGVIDTLDETVIPSAVEAFPRVG